MKNKKDIYFVWDFLILILFVFTLFQFDISVNLNPERYLGYIEVFFVFFILRILFLLYPAFYKKMVVVLVCLVIFQAFWGLGQLYGLLIPQHHLFLTTGSFYNPGPYGGFLATLMPISLYLWLGNRCKKNLQSYLGMLAVVLILLVLPATMSRAAWIAAVLGSGFVMAWEFDLWSILKRYYEFYKILFLAGITIVAVVLFFCVLFLFNIKEDSAKGRVFMAKITGKAIVENNFRSGGIGSFPALYAESQKQYFKKGKGTIQEKRIAGSPEYAFNEYLQLAIEQGVFALLFFLLFLVGCIRKGIKNRQIGFVGSLIALLVFAMFSYPFEFILFLFVFVVLIALILSYEPSPRSAKTRNFSVYCFLLIGLIGGLIFLILKQKKYYDARKQWKVSSFLYRAKKYEKIEKHYNYLYTILNHEPHFVFEYAQLLYGMKKYNKAIIVCNRGLEISSDPMFYNIKGKNNLALGRYILAEDCFKNAINIIPDRIYPYFLMSQLYSNPQFKRNEKLKQVVDSVLYKRVKVYSPAIEEMRLKARELLKNSK